MYALANISELFYQQHEDNKEVYDAIWEAEQNLKDAAEERETQGVWKNVGGVPEAITDLIPNTPDNVTITEIK